MMTIFHYRYRDASNYKAEGAITLVGEDSTKRWEAALARLEASEFFIAEQLDVPPLYQALYAFSGGPTPADHCWHEFVDIAVTDDADLNEHVWGNAKNFVARLLLVDEWKGELSPHFWLGA